MNSQNNSKSMRSKNSQEKSSLKQNSHSKTSKSSFRNGKRSHQKPRINPDDRKIIIFNKPYDTLSQFTDGDGRQTLADFIPVKDIYAAGRLDRDSEGLMILTNDGILQAKITQPQSKSEKTYWVQVDGAPTDNDLEMLRKGVTLKDGLTLPAKVEVILEPEIWPRTPPVRFRANIPTTWLAITIIEGRNRQVRRMTAHIGFPTLRLIRHAMANITLNKLKPGEWREIKTLPKFN